MALSKVMGILLKVDFAEQFNFTKGFQSISNFLS